MLGSTVLWLLITTFLVIFSLVPLITASTVELMVVYVCCSFTEPGRVSRALYID